MSRLARACWGTLGRLCCRVWSRSARVWSFRGVWVLSERRRAVAHGKRRSSEVEEETSAAVMWMLWLKFRQVRN